LAIDFLSPEKLKVNKDNYQTTLPKLYIGGDALRGASTAINAIGDGRKAAAEILRNLSGIKQQNDIPEKKVSIKELLHRKSVREYGITPQESPLNDRQNFSMVMSSYTEHEARTEASRCLQCDEICNVCVGVCPNLANFSYLTAPVTYQLQRAVLSPEGLVTFKDEAPFHVGQEYQILNLRDLCNECGNCVTFCPTSGKPFKDKPGLSLSIEGFKQENEGYFLSDLGSRKVLIHKETNIIRTLTLADNHYIYETDQVKATINPEDFSLLDVKVLTPCVKEVSFAFAAEMSIVMKGALQIL
jgi:putative selenate reductase